MTALHCDKKECPFSEQCIQLMAAKEDAIPPCVEKDGAKPDAQHQPEETARLSKPEPD